MIDDAIDAGIAPEQMADARGYLATVVWQDDARHEQARELVRAAERDVEGRDAPRIRERIARWRARRAPDGSVDSP